mmetsp:Transcript_620/g.1327  ORF Transcript_620/g.1327 Transcript_620/m.1327 type:complete len:113 (+) Transcript_620:952-1290(+)
MRQSTEERGLQRAELEGGEPSMTREEYEDLFPGVRWGGSSVFTLCAMCSVPEAEMGGFACCGKCKGARYCGRECQLAHWPTHKARCKQIVAGNEEKYDKKHKEKERRKESKN